MSDSSTGTCCTESNEFSRISSSESTTSDLTLRPESVAASTTLTAVGSIYDLGIDKNKSLDGASSAESIAVGGVAMDHSRSRRLKNSLKKTVSAMGAPPTMEYDAEHGRSSKRLGVSPMGCGVQSHV